MMPWFLWKGIDSRDMGIWISELPQPTKAAERTKDVNVLGKAGTLTIREGENVHEGYAKNCKITAPWNADFAALLTWLSGDGEVVFSNEPDRVYHAHLASRIEFYRQGNSLKTATIPFFVHPHKGQYPPEVAFAATSGADIWNPGTVTALPLITVTGSGTVAFTLNGEAAMSLTLGANGETVVIDSDAEIITSGGSIWLGEYTTDFLKLPPGTNTLSWAGTATVTIQPRWRWF